MSALQFRPPRTNAVAGDTNVAEIGRKPGGGITTGISGTVGRALDATAVVLVGAARVLVVLGAADRCELLHADVATISAHATTNLRPTRRTTPNLWAPFRVCAAISGDGPKSRQTGG
jgi:hypothetical protein